MGESKRHAPVRLHDQRVVTAVENARDGGNRVLHVLQSHHVAQYKVASARRLRLAMRCSTSRFAVGIVKHDPRAIDQLNMLVQRNLLAHGGNTRGGTDATHFAPFQAVNETAFADIRVANHSHPNRCANISIATYCMRTSE